MNKLNNNSFKHSNNRLSRLNYYNNQSNNTNLKKVRLNNYNN